MNITKTEHHFLHLVQELQSNPGLQILTYHKPVVAHTGSLQAIFPQSLHTFLQAINGVQLHWENAVQQTTFIKGRLHILPASEIAKNWQQVVYFDGDTNNKLHHFRPVDFFADEACCGIYTNHRNHDSLYYYAFNGSEDPYDLGLNMEAYLTLAIEAKCYYYWPLIVKLINQKVSSPIIQKFSADMAVLFPEFSVEKFIKHYQQLKKVVFLNV